MYKLDITGNSPDNAIIGEKISISSITNKHRCYIPAHAPFFSDSMLLVQSGSGVARILHEGVDYTFGHQYKAGSAATDKRVAGSIVLITPLTGILELRTYQTLGGQANVEKGIIVSYVADSNLADPTSTDWETLVELTQPMYAKHRDGVTDTAQMIEAIQALSSRKIGLDDVLLKVVNAKQRATSATSDTLEDRLADYDLSIGDLYEYCKTIGVPESTLVNAVDANGHKAQHAIAVPGSGVVITESDTGTVIATEGNVTLTADLGKKRSGIAASVHGGTHVLSAYSGGTKVTPSCIMIDGWPLIDADMLEEYVSDIAATHSVLDLKTEDTDTVTITGNGTAGNPLKMNVKYTLATHDYPGMVYVTNDFNDMPPGIACSLRIAWDLMGCSRLTVDGDVCVNGHQLSSDVVLTVNDFGLDKVDDRKLDEKPPSTPWLNSAREKAVVGHYDPPIDVASASIEGGVILTNNPDPSVRDKAASVALAKRYADAFTTAANKKIKVVVGRAEQIKQVSANAMSITKNGIFIAYEVT